MGFFEGFVNPALAAGVALAAVPLVIHLLNRRRHRPMQWAAMRFVLAAYRKTRRRAQMENLLLLLLRMAAVALLALAIARPFTGGESPLAGLTETRRDLVLVVDGSASTGYREGVRTVFERIVDRARELVVELDGGRGDRARVLLAGDTPRLLAWTDPGKASAVLDTLAEPTDEGLDLAAALAEVLDFAEEEAAGTGESAIEVRLLTDLQRRSFEERLPAAPGDGAPEAADRAATTPLQEVLDSLAELGVDVVVEDLGPPETAPANLAVVAVEPVEPILGPGAPATVRVVVANHGGERAAGVRAWIEVGGEKRPVQSLDVPPRGEAEALFALTLEQAGDRPVVACVQGDRLAVDDRRVRILHVPEPVRVLLVDGAPAPELERDAVGYLRTVLEPPPSDSPLGADLQTPFVVRELARGAFEGGEAELDRFDLIWLANVDSLSQATIERLERRVAGGAALVMSMGSRVQLEAWNARAFRPDGSGLLPAELRRVVSVASRREAYYRVREFEREHPALSFFADQRWQAHLTEVPVYDFVAVRPLADARVLARLDDEDGSPLLVERAYDRGRVLLWTTTIDPSWTLLPEVPASLVPLVHELVRYAGTPPTPDVHLRPGAGFVATVESFPRRVQLLRPDETRKELRGETEELASGLWRLPPVAPADCARVGLYVIETEGAGTRPFAVELDPRESDLERLLPSELPGLHAALVPFSPEGGGEGEGDEPPRRGELWRWMALAALLALCSESLWAAWIGRRRKIA